MDSRRRTAFDLPVSLSAGRAVRLGLVTGLLSFSLLLVASRLWRSSDAPLPHAPVRPHDATVDVWVGEWVPGVTCVLASPWSQFAWDAASDATLRSSLASGLPAGLVLYDCWLFNTTDQPVTVSVKDGSLLVSPSAPPGSALALRSLSTWLTPRGGVTAPMGGVATVLRALGADRETVELPANRMTRHPVALGERVSLAGVHSVATADGTSFHLRRMPEPEWAALIQSPRRQDLESLR